MKKNTVLAVAAVAVGVYGATKLFSKKNKYTEEELQKIEEYRKYLEDKNYVIVEKNKYNKSSFNLLSTSMLPTYYKAAKLIAKYVV